jgi:carboxypeptidase C (cathepsin A)
MKLKALFAAAALIVFGFATHAEDKKAEGQGSGKKDDNKKELKDESVATHHAVTIRGQKIDYTATAGTMVMKEEEGKPKATFFYVAYTTTNSSEANRPITFSFNGGPGAASIWLHMGALGPRRVQMKEEGQLPQPPYQVVENEFSILDKTDLVFIDPVSTGFSRPAPGEDPRQFHGLDEDVESVGEFIRLYVTRNKRWDSPKFVIGESYGTTRAAHLSNYLQSRFGMYLNGVMLVSVVLDFQTISFVPGNDLPFVLYVPSYCATAWYHKKLSEPLQSDLAKTLEEAEKFASGPYASALFKGTAIPEEEKQNVAAELSRLTGLSKDFVLRANLRVDSGKFFKELLRDRKRSVGRFDSRLLGIDREGVSDNPDYDPSYTSVLGPFTGAFNAYIREELNFESDLPYEPLTGKVRPWNYSSFNNRFVNVGESLRQAATQNPYLKVFVANGIFDLATPYFGTKYTIDHLGLAPESFSHVFMSNYKAGHMMYTHKPSLEALKQDLDRFIESALPPK